MHSRHTKFRQSEITKACRGVTDAGIPIGKVEISPRGWIRVFPTDYPVPTVEVPPATTPGQGGGGES
jgi:hypothetical protein